MMNKKNIKRIIFFLIILFVVTCSEDELPVRKFPRVKTLEVSNISNSGVTFAAEILDTGNQEITEYGFVWSEETNPIIEISDKKVFTDKITTGGFSTQIATTLRKGRNYNTRAYAKSNEYTVYGMTIRFRSAGSGAATINDFYPKLGASGDTITIAGNNFSYLYEKNHVLFKDIESIVIQSTDSTIRCIVPEGIPEKSVPIYLKITDQSTKTKENFELILPEIESFSPLKGTFGQSIKLIGKRFSPVKNENIISFNGHPAEVTEATETSLTVIVPNTLETQFNTIEVTFRSVKNPAEEFFELLAPRIDDISPLSGRPYERIKISGENFNPGIRNRNTVIFDSNEAYVTEASATELTVIVPTDIYSNRTFQVRVRVAGQTAYSTALFTIHVPWIKRENIPSDGNSRYRTTGFSLLNYGYVGLGFNSGLISDFHKYDADQNSWEKITDFGGGKRMDATSFVIGNYAYVGTGRTSQDAGTDNNTNDFWRFDPQSETWTEIASLPLTTRDAVGLSVDGRGYICTPDNSNNFWSYDPANDEWVQMPDLNINSMGGSGIVKTGFVIENKIYIVTEVNSLMQQLYAFDTNTLQWSRKTDAGYNGFTGISFAIKNKGYSIYSNRISEYNPITDSWKTFYKIPPEYRKEGVEFVIEDKAYFGSGFNAESDFWEYSPEYE